MFDIIIPQVKIENMSAGDDMTQIQQTTNSKQNVKDFQWIIDFMHTHKLNKTDTQIRIRRSVYQAQDHFTFDKMCDTRNQCTYVLEYITGTQGMKVATTLYYNASCELQRAVTEKGVYTAERFLKRWKELHPTVCYLSMLLSK